MNDLTKDPGATMRRAVYVGLIIASAGVMTGRIMVVQSAQKVLRSEGNVTCVPGKTPFLCANDISRWCTIRALVDDGTYAIDQIVYQHDEEGDIARNRSHKPIRNREWYTIDMVQHQDRDGNWHNYSSKPPLLPTLLAGEYWLIKNVTGATIEKQPFYVGRLMLAITNVGMMVICFLLLANIIERRGTTDWGRIFLMFCVTFGTFLTTFTVTLNNHLFAAFGVVVATWALIKVWDEGSRGWQYFFLGGFFAAFAFANELPALALFGLYGILFLIKAPVKAIVGYGGAGAIVIAAFFAVNHHVHDSLMPAYGHRTPYEARLEKETLGELPVKDNIEALEYLSLKRVRPSALFREYLENIAGINLGENCFFSERVEGKRWLLHDDENKARYAIVRSGEQLHVLHWDNWYDFDGAYWGSGKEQGVDRGEPSRAWYTFHVLVGHHGIFSLSPIWIISAIGLVLLLTREKELWAVAASTVVLTLIVLFFYIVLRDQVDRNYGGVTSGLRWLFWLIPLWLIVMIPAADWLSQNRWGRTLAWAALAVSIFSAGYASLNPWVNPWLYQYWLALGWC